MVWWSHLAWLVVAITLVMTLPFLSLLIPPVAGIYLIPGFTLCLFGSAAFALFYVAYDVREWRKMPESGVSWDAEKFAAEIRARNERAMLKEEQIRRQPAK